MHLCDHSRLEEVLCRCESGGGVAQGLDKLAHAVAGQFIIINDRDQRRFGHPCVAEKERPPTMATKSQSLFTKFDLAQILAIHIYGLTAGAPGIFLTLSEIIAASCITPWLSSAYLSMSL